MKTQDQHVAWCFKLPSGEQLQLEPEALDILVSYKQAGMFSREAGGQLFAKIVAKKVRIVRATKPSIFDMRSRFGFRPSLKHVQRQIDRQYAKGLHFVGDWHTHPEKYPSPSQTDLDSMHEMFSKSVHSLNGYIMMIVGTAEGPDSIHVSVHQSDSWTRLYPCTGTHSHD